MKIIHEEKDYILVHKEAFLATQTAKLGEMDLYSKVKNYLVEQYQDKDPYLAVINRLDQPVEGIVLFAKNAKTAANLSAQLQNNKIEKKYLAVIYGVPEKTEGQVINFIRKNPKTNLSEIVSEKIKDSKKAVLSYSIRTHTQLETLLEINLQTGRHHQIRVQLSHMGYPILGDLKYGIPESIEFSRQQSIKKIALCAYKIAFLHPVTNEKKEYEIIPIHEEIQKMLQGE